MFIPGGDLRYTARMQADTRIRDFQEQVWAHYAAHGRQMAWRDFPTPYNVVISEVMLQQTQVGRVRHKFAEWIDRWDDFASLSQASVAEVLTTWQGLGYNRRALWVKELADRVMNEYGGALPASQAELTQFRGIGPNTAGAILAYAFDQPAVFIETNIRRVFLYDFFADADDVGDVELLPYIEATIDHDHPREWYWALMDYGTFLASQVVNPNRRSKHYARQSKFEGSHRQLRGAILAEVLKSEVQTIASLSGLLGRTDYEIRQAVEELIAEGFLSRVDERITMKTTSS